MHIIDRIIVEKWLGILLFVLYLVLQIILSGFINVSTSKLWYYGGFNISLTSSFQLQWYTAVIIFILSLLLTYGKITLSVLYNDESYNVIGETSILYEINNKFFAGQRAKTLNDYSNEEIKTYINEKSDSELLFKQLETGYIISELIDDFNFKTVSKVFLTRNRIPNAYTFRNILPHPKLGKDWIVIHSNLCEILNYDELRAVLSHELVHISNRDSLFHSFMHSPKFIIAIAWLKFYFDLLFSVFNTPISTIIVISRIVYILLVYVLIRYVLAFIGLHINNFVNRRMEFLADFGSAGLVGGLAMVNAVIKLGQRSEVISVIEEETKWVVNRLRSPDIEAMVLDALHYIEADEMSTDEARTKALEYAITHVIKMTFEALKLNRHHQLRAKLINASLRRLQNERNKERKTTIAVADLTEQDIKKYLTNWRKMDKNENNYLEETEIVNLIEELQNGKLVFKADLLAKYNILLLDQSHPSISDRISFLYKTTIQGK